MSQKKKEKKKINTGTSSSLSGHVNQGASGLKSYLLVTNGEKKKILPTLCILKDLIMSCTFLFFFSSFIYVPGLAAQ